ncbi:MAG: antitoxin CptB [Oceanicoccus sp.]|jgi:antitoxin CptB
MISDHEYKRTCWASRRGMLELDLLLVPFVEEKLRQLDDVSQQRYIELLVSEDNDLFAWLLGHDTPENPEFKIIIGQIRDYSNNR